MKLLGHMVVSLWADEHSSQHGTRDIGIRIMETTCNHGHTYRVKSGPGEGFNRPTVVQFWTNEQKQAEREFPELTEAMGFLKECLVRACESFIGNSIALDDLKDQVSTAFATQMGSGPFDESMQDKRN